MKSNADDKKNKDSAPLNHISDAMEMADDEREDLNDSEDLTWEEISTEHIVQDEWIDFRRSAYRFPDGSVFEPYYSYSRRDYVVVVASDEDGKYMRQAVSSGDKGSDNRISGRRYRADGW